MVVHRVQLEKNVVEMARQRIINIFKNDVPINLSMSGGKDSIVLAHLVYSLIEEGRIDPSRLTVDFVDEEAMHQEVIRIAEDWRKRFLQVGAKFIWWCIEVRHFNCFNQLTNDESFICWDSEKKDSWVRPMPSFAVTSHPLLRNRVDTYQEFMTRLGKGSIQLTGVRVAESLQRLKSFSMTPSRPMFQPIYDMKDTDIWLYIKEHEMDFPETYLHLYQTGSSRREMRLSQFFSIDTARVLVKLSEYDSGLMERVIRREPNAYLAALYWDSEMFRSSKSKGRKGNTEKVEDEIDYEEATMRLLASPDYADTSSNKLKRANARSVRTLILRSGGKLFPAAWKSAYEILYAGDPKNRTTRALYTAVAQKDRSDIDAGK